MDVRLNHKSGVSKGVIGGIVWGYEIEIETTDRPSCQTGGIHRAKGQTGLATELSLQCNCNLNFLYQIKIGMEAVRAALCTTLFSHPVATVQRIGSMETFIVLLQLQLQMVAI
jgi:hypothetical protein